MKLIRWMAIAILALALCSCAGGRQPVVSEAEKQEYPNVGKLESVSMDTVRKEPKLSAAYDNIALNPVQISQQFVTDYPDLSIQFQTAVLTQLKSKKMYKRVDSIDGKENLAMFKGDTLVVDTKVIDIRIVGTGARIWAGAMAGASYITVYIKLTDALTGKAVLEKILATHNNAMASAWAPGTESSLPVDMGKIVGEYIGTIIPAK